MSSLAYFLMPRYGQSLHEILASRGNKLSSMSVYSLGIKLIDILELIHNSGLVYNDLKPDNILIGSNDKIPRSKQSSKQNIFEDVSINLIDFGFAKKWMDSKTGQHVKRKDLDFFLGNIYFSSVNQLQIRSSSRRDDLHSLAYLMMYLLNDCSIPIVKDALLSSTTNQIDRLRSIL